jgi:hypothetical protein
MKKECLIAFDHSETVQKEIGMMIQWIKKGTVVNQLYLPAQWWCKRGCSKGGKKVVK